MGIESVMSIGLFSYAMISSYILFIDAQTIEIVVRQILTAKSSLMSLCAKALSYRPQPSGFGGSNHD